MKKQIAFVLFCIVYWISITGCSLNETSELTEGNSSTTSECEESGSTNCDQDTTTSFLELFIKSPNPLEAYSSFGSCRTLSAVAEPQTPDASLNTAYCFDISGECNEGTNASAHIVLRSTTFASGTTVFANPTLFATCRQGRFHGQLKVNFVASDLCKRHTIELELIGKKLNNDEETNPVKARKFLDLIAKNHASCP